MTTLQRVTYGFEAPELQDLSPFIESLAIHPLLTRCPAGELWCCESGDLPRRSPKAVYVKAAEPLLQYLRERSIYGHPSLKDLSAEHYLELIGQGDTILVLVKYQAIIGQHILGRVPRQAYLNLLETAP